MTLTRDTYTITRATLERVLAALGDHHTDTVEGETYNNDDVIEADRALTAEVAAQTGPDTARQSLVAEAFLLGFMVSRPGFCGECAFEHCAPSTLKSDHGWTEAEWRAHIAGNEAFTTLRAEAVKRLAP